MVGRLILLIGWVSGLKEVGFIWSGSYSGSARSISELLICNLVYSDCLLDCIIQSIFNSIGRVQFGQSIN